MYKSINAAGLDKVNQGNSINREVQMKGSKNPRRKCHARILRPSVVIPGSVSFTVGDHYWEQCLIKFLCSALRVHNQRN